MSYLMYLSHLFFQAEDGIRDLTVTGVQTCALPICQGNGPGLVLLVPLIDKMVKVSLQTVALDVAPQDVITRDNVSLKVSAVIYFRVVDPERAVIAVQDYLYATSQIAQTTLRSVLGQVELDDLLSARDKVNQQLQR